jgi:hypothetical protein
VCIADSPSNGSVVWSLQGFGASGVIIVLTSAGLASTYGGFRCIGIHD